MEVDDGHQSANIPLSKRNLLLFSANESDVKFIFTLESNLEVFLYGHKKILSIGSCVFEQMFYGLMATISNETLDTVYIADIPIECFKNVLMFIYIGAVELNLGNVFEVMYAAHKYEVCKLESLCCDFLYKNMDISNVLQIYELSLVFNNNITKQCLHWIDDLFDDLVKWEGFTNLKKSSLMELIQRDTLNISELNLFKAVYKWAEKHCYDASMEPSDANLRTAVDNFKYIRFPTMSYIEFGECTRYGLNILTPDEKVDVWDAVSKVKQSVHFNSTKRIQSTKLYRAFSFHYAPEAYNADMKYTFEFFVRRIVYLTSITVIRNCILTISEKEPGEIAFTQGKQFMIHVNESKPINYSFVPNVKYALTTADCSFKCGYRCSSFDPKFRNYFEMQQYYNRIAKAGPWNFDEHDPFFFTNPQDTLIRNITYKMSK